MPRASVFGRSASPSGRSAGPALQAEEAPLRPARTGTLRLCLRLRRGELSEKSLLPGLGLEETLAESMDRIFSGRVGPGPRLLLASGPGASGGGGQGGSEEAGDAVVEGLGVVGHGGLLHVSLT